MEEHEKSGNVTQFNERQPVKGTLKYTVFRNGIPVEETEEPNLIVAAGKEQTARLLGGDAAGRSIAGISFGTGGSLPVLADTVIAGAFTKNIDSVDYPSPGQARFNWTLSTKESNGKAILEFGLVCGNGTLYSRRVRESGKPINKESDLSLEGSWTIEF
jgi:hypothetical protein